MIFPGLGKCSLAAVAAGGGVTALDGSSLLPFQPETALKHFPFPPSLHPARPWKPPRMEFLCISRVNLSDVNLLL